MCETLTNLTERLETTCGMVTPYKRNRYDYLRSDDVGRLFGQLV